MLIGIAALLTGQTLDIIVLSVFGALMLYIISMLSLLIFRKKESYAPRPYKVPFYPLTPVVALVLATVSLIAVIRFYPYHALVFFILMFIAFVVFRIFVKLPLVNSENKKL